MSATETDWKHAFHKSQAHVDALEATLRGWEQVRELYSLMRSQLVEMEAWELHGGFQAAANGKSIEECRRIASYKLRVHCPECQGTGTLECSHYSPQFFETVQCDACNGSGFILLPELDWLNNGVIQPSLLPSDHPDYAPIS